MSPRQENAFTFCTFFFDNEKLKWASDSLTVNECAVFWVLAIMLFLGSILTIGFNQLKSHCFAGSFAGILNFRLCETRIGLN